MIRREARKFIRRLADNHYQPLNRIELNTQHLLHNVRLIQKLNPGHSIIPVVKANAYGHGLLQIAEMLNRADCSFLAVDGYFEAAQIRDITRHRVLVMGYIRPANARLLDTKRCSFVVQDIAGLRALGVLKRPVRVHLELNTGMYRLGLTPNELTEYLSTLKSYPNLQLEGVMTHLADADNGGSNTFTTKQVKLFDQTVGHILAQGFKPAFFHIAQTAGSTKVHSRYANAVRLGIGLYGINPLQPSDEHFKDLVGLQPVLGLKSTIIKVYDLKKGDRVSYNGIFTAPHSMRIGILPLGYYEGLPRALSNKGCVTGGKKQLPIVGRICMNHTIIDLKDTQLWVGDEVVVIDDDILQPNSLQSASRMSGNFSYEWLANLSSSLQRVIY